MLAGRLQRAACVSAACSAGRGREERDVQVLTRQGVEWQGAQRAAVSVVAQPRVQRVRLLDGLHGAGACALSVYNRACL